jgi:hypothetical protein
MGAAAATTVGGLVWLAPRSAAAAGDAPVVTGPITGGQHGWPFGSYIGDLSKYGYVEEEYFLSGEAARYRPRGELSGDFRWDVEPAGTGPYTTRIIVHRPRDPAKFNGTVLVQWLNVSSGFDLVGVGETMFEGGFAMVGVSCQYVSVNGFSKNPKGLKAWDGQRYGALSLPAESLCYDIFTQAAHAVGPRRPTGGVDPMGGLPVKKLIATGGSQSAAKLVTYANAIQPLEHTFDAIMPTVSAAFAGGFGDEVMDPTAASAFEDRLRVFRQGVGIRTDLDIPVMIVNSEFEALRSYPARQPDTDHYRFWEVAGASHSGGRSRGGLEAALKRDGVLEPGFVSKGRPSEVDKAPVMEAATFHLQSWINGGAPPPSQPTIDIIAGPTPKIARDEFGNAKGGVRLPEMEVPVAHYIGRMDGPTADLNMGGETVPFSPEVLHRLYPSHADYVAKVAAAAEGAAKAGVIRRHSVKDYVADAQAMTI